MVDYCQENDIILQPVVAYNLIMQARVEGAIGCSEICCACQRFMKLVSFITS